MSIIGSNVLAGASGSGVEAYEIEQSLRFDGSAHLNRTPGTAGSTTTWTWSGWVKVPPSGEQTIFSAVKGSGYTAMFYNVGGEAHHRLSQYVNPTNEFTKSTTARYRDPSAWRHLVVVCDTTNSTASDRIRYYFNGEQVTAFSNDGSSQTNVDPSSSQATGINTTSTQRIGSQFDGTYAFLDGYMAEVHFLDGTAVTDAEDFGEYDDNGVWRPIEVSGVTYGTNGYYLKFDPSATNGIGHDHSGNGNNWTPSGFTTSGTGTDVMSDTPTNNFATLNDVDHSTDAVPLGFAEGNLQVQHRSGSGSYSLAASTIAFDSDDSDGFYFESIATDHVSSSYQSVCLIDADKTVQDFIGNAPVGSSTGSEFGIGWESNSGYLRNFGTTMSGWGPTTTTWTTDGDILMVFVKNNKVYLGKNGTWLKSADPSTESNPAITLSSAYKLKPGTAGRYSAKQSFNFGQRDFSYTPPTGAKTICTSNLPEPDIADGSEYFGTLLYTADNSAGKTVTGLNFGAAPDFVWIKNRDNVEAHHLMDVVRGNDAFLFSNNNNQEQNKPLNDTSDTTDFDFETDGFSFVSTNYSQGELYFNNRTYVGWNWKAGGSVSADNNTNGSITSTVSVNATAGFSIVTYTGTGAGATVGHGLGVAPSFIYTKSRDGGDWGVYHAVPGAGKVAYGNLTNAFASSIYPWNNTEPTSTVFSIGNADVSGTNGEDYVAYCFAEVESYSRIGSYVGNGSSDGPFVMTSFSPAWIMTKNSSTGGAGYDWYIFDSERNTYNPVGVRVKANANDAETSTTAIDLLSNGFKIRTSDSSWNRNGDTFVYMCFAQNPFGGSGVSPATAR